MADSDLLNNQRKMDHHLAFMTSMFPKKQSQASDDKKESLQKEGSNDHGNHTDTPTKSIGDAKTDGFKEATRSLPSLMDRIEDDENECEEDHKENRDKNVIPKDSNDLPRFDELVYQEDGRGEEENETKELKKNDRRATIDDGLTVAAARKRSSTNNRRRSSPLFRSLSPMRTQRRKVNVHKTRFPSPLQCRAPQIPPSVSETCGSIQTIEGNSNKTLETSNVSMEEYVQKSSRFQSFIGHAFQSVKKATAHRNADGSSKTIKRKKQKKRRRGISSVSSMGDSDDLSIGSQESSSRQDTQEVETPSVEFDVSTHRVVRDQTTEIFALKKQLEEMQQEHQALRTQHDSLQHELETTQEQAEKARAAARVASDNARQARADAESAETTASIMAQQLEDLQTVAQETKKACQLLQVEHQQVEDKATRAENALFQKGVELTRMRQNLTQQQAQQELFEATRRTWQRQHDTLQTKLTDQSKLVETLERQQHESHSLASARLERLQKLQEEWSNVQTRLEEETQSKLEIQDALMKMSESVTKLQTANGELHAQLHKEQEEHHETNVAQQEELNKTSQEALQLRIEIERLQDDLRRLEVTSRNTESSTSRKTQVLPPLPPKHFVSQMTEKEAQSANEETAPKGKENGQLVGNNSTWNTTKKLTTGPKACCSICNKAAFGLMKRCQCGKANCQKRAHLTCANRVNAPSSVSHPGTPAPHLPLILCGPAITPNKDKATPKMPLGTHSIVNSNA